MLRSTGHEESDAAERLNSNPGGRGAAAQGASISAPLVACWPSVHLPWCVSAEVLCPFSTWVFVSMFLGFGSFSIYSRYCILEPISSQIRGPDISPLLWALPSLCTVPWRP